MNKEWLRLYDQVVDAYEVIHVKVKRQFGLNVEKFANNLEEAADAVLVLREMSKFADQLRKEMNRLQETIEKITCLRWLQEVQSGSRDAVPIRTSWCTASPDLKQSAKIPSRRKEPERFAEVMIGLGVPESLWAEGDNPLVDINWKGLTDFITERSSAGQPLPPGLKAEDTYFLYRLLLRIKQGLRHAE